MLRGIEKLSKVILLSSKLLGYRQLEEEAASHSLINSVFIPLLLHHMTRGSNTDSQGSRLLLPPLPRQRNKAEKKKIPIDIPKEEKEEVNFAAVRGW